MAHAAARRCPPILLLLCLGLGACAPPWSAAPTPSPIAPPSGECALTPNATHEANGHTLDGKRGGGMFIYPAADRVFKPNVPEKMLVFLDPLPATLPSPLVVHGRNRDSGTTAIFENVQHRSEYGTEWGTNYIFPDAGCWELRVGEPGSRDLVVIAVAP